MFFSGESFKGDYLVQRAKSIDANRFHVGLHKLAVEHANVAYEKLDNTAVHGKHKQR